MSSMDQSRPDDDAHHLQPGARLSRRRLLGAGVLALAAPALRTEPAAGAAHRPARALAANSATDRRARLLAVLRDHGPELGGGR